MAQFGFTALTARVILMWIKAFHSLCPMVDYGLSAGPFTGGNLSEGNQYLLGIIMAQLERLSQK